jgi:hypothetical protein
MQAQKEAKILVGTPESLDQDAKERWRGITTCWQSGSYHVYGVGPCLDTLEEAIEYRNELDKKGLRRMPYIDY